MPYRFAIFAAAFAVGYRLTRTRAEAAFVRSVRADIDALPVVVR